MSGFYADSLADSSVFVGYSVYSTIQQVMYKVVGNGTPRGNCHADKSEVFPFGVTSVTVDDEEPQDISGMITSNVTVKPGAHNFQFAYTGLPEGFAAAGTVNFTKQLLPNGESTIGTGQVYTFDEPGDYTIGLAVNIQDNEGKVAAARIQFITVTVEPEAQDLSGTITYTSGVNPGKPIGILLGGTVSSIAEGKLHYQWQVDNSGNWENISSPGAQERNFTPTEDLLGKTIRLTITAEGYNGTVVGKGAEVKKIFNPAKPAAFSLSAQAPDYTSFIITGFDNENQEYVWSASPISDTSTIDWTTNTITSNPATGFTAGNTYYVYTRYKETDSTQASIGIREASVILSATSHLSKLVLEGYDDYGPGSYIFVPKGDYVDINLSTNPGDANDWQSITLGFQGGAQGIYTVTPTSIPYGSTMPASIRIEGSTVGSTSLKAYTSTATSYGEWNVVVYDQNDLSTLSKVVAVPGLAYDNVTLNKGDSYTPAAQTVNLKPDGALGSGANQYRLEWRVCTTPAVSAMTVNKYEGQSNPYISVDAQTGEVTALADTTALSGYDIAYKDVVLYAVRNSDNSSIQRLGWYTVTVNDSTVSVESVSLNKTTLWLNVGNTETLKAMVSPANAANKTVSFASDNTAVATVDATGKVDAVSAGTATITVTTADGGKTAACTVNVDQNLNITTTALPDGEKGVAYGTQTLSASLTGVNWSIASGVLPYGMSLDASTGKISGTPTVSGKFNFKVAAIKDSQIATKDLSISVTAAPTITTTDLENGTVGAPYSAYLSADGYPEAIWEITTGSLPTGLTLNADGTISGTPTTANTFNFTVKATNGIGTDATQDLSITIDTPTAITAANVTVTAPVKGAALTNATTSDTNYGMTTAWSPDTTTFAAGTVYTATMTLTADSGYVFNSSTVFNINGTPVTPSAQTATTATISVTFPRTASNSGSGDGGGGVTNYTLSFNTNGGSAISSVSKSSGATVDLASYKPTKTGYDFAGWYNDKALTDKVTSVKLTKNTTVYAKWTAIDPDMPFVDVPSDAYYKDAVEWAVEEGITSGTSATTFDPNGICTRAQAVTFLWRASGEPKATVTSSPFTDVDAGAYYYKAVLWATEKGIVKGTSATTFSPDMNCTRAQIVTLQYRTAGSPAAGTVNPFADVSADAYYADAVLWAVKEDITQGTSATTFSPDNNCTRAQIVTFLYRQLGK